MAKAVKIAGQYQVILAFEDGHWYGRGLELPNIHGDGKTVGQCVEDTRKAFAGWVHGTSQITDQRCRSPLWCMRLACAEKCRRDARTTKY